MLSLFVLCVCFVCLLLLLEGGFVCLFVVVVFCIFNVVFFPFFLEGFVCFMCAFLF